MSERQAAGGSALATLAAGNDYILADLLEREGNREEALRVLGSAAEQHSTSNPYLPLILGSLADLQRDGGRSRDALSTLDRALRIAESQEQGFPITRPTILLDLGHVYLSLGMVDLALPPLEKGYSLADQDRLASPELYGLAVFRRILLAQTIEDFELQARIASRYTHDRERDANRTGGWRHLVPPQTHAAIVLRTGFGRVEADFRAGAGGTDGAAILDEVRSSKDVARADLSRAWAWTALSQLDSGDRVQAGESLARAERLLAQLPGPRFLEGVEVAALRARWWSMGSDSETEEREAHYAEEFFPAWNAFLEDWARTPLRKGGIGFLQHLRRRAVVGTLLDACVGAKGDGARRALAEVLRVQALGTTARSAGLEAGSPTSLQAFLAEEQAGLLQWVPGRESVHVFAVDQGGVLHQRLEPAHRLLSRVRRVNRTMRSVLRPTGSASKDARLDLEQALAETTGALLPESWLDRLGSWNTVILVGLDDLGDPPFEALGQELGGWGRELAICRWPSIPIGLWLAGTDRTPRVLPRSAVLLAARGSAAAPYSQSRFPPLGLKEEELRRMVQPLVPDPRILWPEEGRSSWDRVRTEKVESVLHLWAHGLYLMDEESPSGVLVDPGMGAKGVLTATRLEAAPALPPVVFLTACGVGRSRPRRGDDGRGSLASAVFQAGGVAVVDSALDVELNAALDFFEHVYAGLEDGASLAEAFRRARVHAQPEDLGVATIHSSLMRLRGNGLLRFQTQ